MFVRYMTTGPRCARCSMRPDLCICASLPRIETKTRVSLILHSLESTKSTNTGRLAVECLTNSEKFVFGARAPLPARVWPEGARPVVLFPIANARPVTDFAGDGLCLIVLDASWRQAARLRKRFASRNIPFAQVPPGGPSQYALRAEPHARGLSTLEAIARSLQALEGGTIEADMLRPFSQFQDRTLWLRGDKTTDAVEGGIPDGVVRHRSYDAELK